MEKEVREGEFLNSSVELILLVLILTVQSLECNVFFNYVAVQVETDLYVRWQLMFDVLLPASVNVQGTTKFQ